MDISDQSKIFNKVTYNYFLDYNNVVKVGWNTTTQFDIEYNYDEILEVAKHHANCGENVYLIAFPRCFSIGERPDTLFFLNTFEEIIDVPAIDSGLVLILKHHESGFAFWSALEHLSKNFKSCCVLMLDYKIL